MPVKRKLVLYEAEVEEYLLTLKSKKGQSADNETKRKYRLALANMMLILQERNHTWPDTADYELYSSRSTVNASETGKNKNRVKNFFEWLERRQDTPMDNEEIKEQAVIEPEPEPEKRNAGRPRIDGENGEIRKGKITVYLTPTQEAAFKALCLIDGVTLATRINELIDAEINSAENQEIINSFLALKEKRKER